MTDDQQGRVSGVTPPSGPGGLGPRWLRQGLIGLLAGLLGFALVVQLRTTSGDSNLSAARTSDLIGILDDLGQRSQRLEQEATRLESTREQLLSGADQESVARQELRSELKTLQVLTGTVPVQGPGVEIVVSDPQRQVGAAELLDAVEELRDAGAESLDVAGVRWVASSYVTQTPDGLVVDGTPVRPPYVITAIGDPSTMASALAIPGGVVESLQAVGAQVSVTQHDSLSIRSLKPLPQPQYAHPASPGP